VIENELTLERFCRALAAHAMIVGHPGELRKFTAPEVTQTVADIITRFALGEDIGRPTMGTAGEDF